MPFHTRELGVPAVGVEGETHFQMETAQRGHASGHSPSRGEMAPSRGAGGAAPFGSACVPAHAALGTHFKLWPQDPHPLFTEGAKERLFMGC